MTSNLSTKMIKTKSTRVFHPMIKKVNRIKRSPTKNNLLAWIQQMWSFCKKFKSFASHVTNLNAQFFVPVFAEGLTTESVMKKYLTTKKKLPKTKKFKKLGIALTNGKKSFKPNQNALHAYQKAIHIFWRVQNVAIKANTRPKTKSLPKRTRSPKSQTTWTKMKMKTNKHYLSAQ